MDKILLNKLIESKNFTAIAEKLGQLHPADIAEFLKDLDSEEQAIILKLLDAHKAGDALSEIDSEDREELLDEIGSDELTRLVEFLPADDTTDILSETPEEITEEVLTKLTPKDSAEIEELLTYDEDSASGIMDPELLAVPEVWTVGQTLESIKTVETDEPIYYVYAVDYQNRLVGFVPLQQLIREDNSRPLGSIMNKQFVAVKKDTDQEKVARIVQKYDLMAIPVIDEKGCLCGRITVDDIIDVIEEETTEDFFRLAGAFRWSEETHSIFKTAMQRLPWLVVALVGSLIGASFQIFFKPKIGVSWFEIFVPFVIVIAAMGGNVGIQSCTTLVRGMATGDIDDNVGKAVFREILISIIVGVACSLIAAIFVNLRHVANPWLISSVVGISLFFSILLSASVGALAPATCKKFGIDPTAASGPFVTVTLDIIGIFIYFTIAIISLKIAGYN